MSLIGIIKRLDKNIISDLVKFIRTTTSFFYRITKILFSKGFDHSKILSVVTPINPKNKYFDSIYTNYTFYKSRKLNNYIYIVLLKIAVVYSFKTTIAHNRNNLSTYSINV